MKRLEGRVALITGAMRGIGLAIAERYLEEGACVALADLAAPRADDVQATLKRLGSGSSYLQLDVAQEAAWIAAEKSLRSAHGRLDILVNNAGIDCTGAIESLEYSAWRHLMSINVDGVFLGTKTFTHLLGETGKKTKRGSSIINMSSIMGLVGLSEASAYNASKGAIRLFTKAVALEYAKKGTPIRVNSIHPGFVDTPLLEIGMQKWVDRGMAASAKELIDGLAASTPNGRLAEPSEIAGVAFFLASDDSSYCTGAEFVVDGGWTAQ
jgi:NAD(P)-dependent dehydrogenase (short-subunit alcohol dehydrogenase family)